MTSNMKFHNICVNDLYIYIFDIDLKPDSIKAFIPIKLIYGNPSLNADDNNNQLYTDNLQAITFIEI